MKRYQTQAIVGAIVGAGIMGIDNKLSVILGIAIAIFAIVITLAGDE